MDQTIRVILVEDHQLVRDGIRSLLKGSERIEIVAEVGDGHAALDAIRKHKPDVVLMDIGLPGLNGLDVSARAVKDFPATRIIILSMHSSEEYVCEALRSGASGYLLKDSGSSELEAALKAVAGGETYLSPKIAKHVADYVRRVTAGEGKATALTPRQREILQAIAEGKSTKEIAHLLEVSVKTVETHRTQLMERLKIYDVAGLVRYAIRIGLVSQDQ